MSHWKSTGDRHLDELKDINLNLCQLNENIIRLCYILTESSISSPSPVSDDPDIPAVGFTANNRKISVCDGCSQTPDCIKDESRNDTDT